VEAGIGEERGGISVRKSMDFTAENAEVAEKRENQISGIILDAAIAVHTAVGPGLLESAYQACLTYELNSRGLKVQTQVPLPIKYRGVLIDAAYRLDLVVDDLVIVELKAVERLMPIHEAQLLSYLKLSGKRLGLLINFDVLRLKDGYKRIVNGL
jgi:GxxExxY protein